MRDAIFRRRENQYRLIKYGEAYAINAHKNKAKLSLINVHQDRRIIGSTKKFVFFFRGKESNKEKAMSWR
jgi:hypothetical protein